MRAILFVIMLALFGCDGASYPAASAPREANTMVYPITKTDAEWREILTPEQYRILRQKGTERPGTSEYCQIHAPGMYTCAGCGNELFKSETKFESGSGWPSYFAPVNEGAVVTETDRSHGMVRTEVLCSQCGGHLGHVFNDGPAPTGLRYCINGAALKHVEPE